MPEWGQLPIPQRLLERGVRGMVRISKARMTGTSCGACVLHIAPESAVGGPHSRSCSTVKRRADWQPPAPKYGRRYGPVHLKHITQANEGCDFGFLAAGPPTPEPEIH